VPAVRRGIGPHLEDLGRVLARPVALAADPGVILLGGEDARAEAREEELDAETLLVAEREARGIGLVEDRLAGAREVVPCRGRGLGVEAGLLEQRLVEVDGEALQEGRGRI